MKINHSFPNCLFRFLPLSTKGKGSFKGQTLVEYALILAIISILAIAMMINLTSNVHAIYSNIDSQVSRSNNGS